MIAPVAQDEESRLRVGVIFLIWSEKAEQPARHRADYGADRPAEHEALCRAGQRPDDLGIILYGVFVLLNVRLTADDPRQAKRFAGRLLAESIDDAQRVERGFILAYGRPPTGEEKSAVAGYLADVKAKLSGDAMKAWESVARALFLSNEFVYID